MQWYDDGFGQEWAGNFFHGCFDWYVGTNGWKSRWDVEDIMLVLYRNDHKRVKILFRYGYRKRIFSWYLYRISVSSKDMDDIILVLFRNDYERVKVLFRYGYRLEKKESMTDPLKKIELFKVNLWYHHIHLYCLKDFIIYNFFSCFQTDPPAPFLGPGQSCLHSCLPGKSQRGGNRLLLSNQEVGGALSRHLLKEYLFRCFEFACEANFRKATIPEYKREYEEIEDRSVRLPRDEKERKNTQTNKQTNTG